MKYSVDRFEQEYAVLIDDDGHSVTVLISSLPNGAKPGSVLKKDNDNFVFDETETLARKKRLLNLQNNLFSE